MFPALSCGAIMTSAAPLTIPPLQRAAAIDVTGQHPDSARRGTPTAFGLLVAITLIHSTASAPFLLAITGFSTIRRAEDLCRLSVRYRLGPHGVGVGRSVAGRPGRQAPPWVRCWTMAVARW